MNIDKICKANILVKRNHKIESQCKRTSKRESDLLEAGPSPRGGKEGRPSPPSRSHPRVFVCHKYLKDYRETWNDVLRSKIAPQRWQNNAHIRFLDPCRRTMQITTNITTTIIILAAIIILIINIIIIGPKRQKPKTALINYSRPGDRGQQWQVPLPCIIDQLLLAHRCISLFPGYWNMNNIDDTNNPHKSAKISTKIIYLVNSGKRLFHALFTNHCLLSLPSVS